MHFVPAEGWRLLLLSRFLAARHRGRAEPRQQQLQEFCSASSRHSCALLAPGTALLLPWKSAGVKEQIPGFRIAWEQHHRWCLWDEPAGRSAKLKSLLDFNRLLIKTEMGFCPWVEQNSA